MLVHRGAAQCKGVPLHTCSQYGNTELPRRCLPLCSCPLCSFAGDVVPLPGFLFFKTHHSCHCICSLSLSWSPQFLALLHCQGVLFAKSLHWGAGCCAQVMCGSWQKNAGVSPFTFYFTQNMFSVISYPVCEHFK